MNQNIMQTIDAWRRFKRLTIFNVCKLSGMSVSTYQRRLKYPEDLTVRELAYLCSAIGVSTELVVNEDV